MALIKQGPQGSSVVVFVMAVVVLPALLFYNLNIYDRKAQVENYVSTQGTVTHIAWKTDSKTCGEILEQCRDHLQILVYQTPNITYQYSVGGRIYTSSRYSFSRQNRLRFFEDSIPGQMSMRDVAAFSQLFASGQSIPVFYDSEKPSFSVLSNDNRDQKFEVYKHLFILFMLFFLASATAIAFNHLYITISIFGIYIILAWWIEQHADSFF